MPLIHCPECSKEISDASDKCIHCGYPINTQQAAQQVEITSVNLASKNKIKRFAIACILLACISGAAFFLYKHHIEFEAEQHITEVYIITGKTAIIAKMIFALTYTTWSTEINAQQDFNLALGTLYRVLLVPSLDTMRKNTQNIDVLHGKIIKNEGVPPHLYNEYIELHGKYKNLVRLASSPQGTLLSYGTDSRKLVNEYESSEEKLKPKIDGKIANKDFLEWLISKLIK